MKTKRSTIILGLMTLLVIAGGVIVLFAAHNQNASITSFQSCVDHGFPVAETNPKTCTGPDGKKYTGPQSKEDTTKNTGNNSATQQPAASQPPVENNARQTISLSVYFSKNPESLNDFTYTQAVARSSSRDDMGTYTIEQLIAGPTTTEAANGLFSPLKGKLQGDSNCNGKDFALAVANKTARLKFCRVIMSAGIGDDARITNTVTDTLKQFSSVDSVTILTKDGNCFGDQSGQNRCL